MPPGTVDRGASTQPDPAPEDEAPEDEAPEDEAPEDEAPEDEAPKDEAPKVKARCPACNGLNAVKIKGEDGEDLLSCPDCGKSSPLDVNEKKYGWTARQLRRVPYAGKPLQWASQHKALILAGATVGAFGAAGLAPAAIVWGGARLARIATRGPRNMVRNNAQKAMGKAKEIAADHGGTVKTALGVGDLKQQGGMEVRPGQPAERTRQAGTGQSPQCCCDKTRFEVSDPQRPQRGQRRGQRCGACNPVGQTSAPTK